MQRLTKSSKGLMVCDECYNEKSDCGYCESISEAIQKLAEYEDLEEQGLLLRLPCKVGSKVWIVDYGICEMPLPSVVCEIFFNEEKEYTLRCVSVHSDNESYAVDLYDFSAIGKKIFFTKQEAEKKLREMEE